MNVIDHTERVIEECIGKLRAGESSSAVIALSDHIFDCAKYISQDSNKSFLEETGTRVNEPYQLADATAVVCMASIIRMCSSIHPGGLTAIKVIYDIAFDQIRLMEEKAAENAE